MQRLVGLGSLKFLDVRVQASLRSRFGGGKWRRQVEGGPQEYAFSKEMRTQKGPGVEERVESLGGRPSRVRIFKRNAYAEGPRSGGAS